MKCPVCATPELLMTERQGVEIDYCPQCQGVWLDRVELDKIIERSMCVASSANATHAATSEFTPTVQQMRTAQAQQLYRQAPQPYYDQRHGHHGQYGHDNRHGCDSHGMSRKKSVWEELFN